MLLIPKAVFIAYIEHLKSRDIPPPKVAALFPPQGGCAITLISATNIHFRHHTQTGAAVLRKTQGQKNVLNQIVVKQLLQCEFKLNHYR